MTCGLGRRWNDQYPGVNRSRQAFQRRAPAPRPTDRSTEFRPLRRSSPGRRVVGEGVELVVLTGVNQVSPYEPGDPRRLCHRLIDPPADEPRSTSKEDPVGCREGMGYGTWPLDF